MIWFTKKVLEENYVVDVPNFNEETCERNHTKQEDIWEILGINKPSQESMSSSQLENYGTIYEISSIKNIYIYTSVVVQQRVCFTCLNYKFNISLQFCATLQSRVQIVIVREIRASQSVISKYDTLTPERVSGKLCIVKYSHHLCPHLISHRCACALTRIKAMVQMGDNGMESNEH